MVRKISKEDLEAGIRVDKLGRMLYHPDFHPNKGKPYTEEDFEYICKFCHFDDLRSLSFALGRPENSIAQTISNLRKQGKFGYYKRLNKHYLSRR